MKFAPVENEAMIQSIKGIGPKSAKRIILELKDKVGKSSATPFWQHTK